MGAHVVAVAVAVLGATGGVSQAHAQAGKLGSYSGTINASGTLNSPQVSYRATIKLTLPVTQRNASSISAEFLAGEAPNATALISQWDITHREKSAGADGKFASWTCTLANAVEVPMTPTGVLNVDLKAKKHALSVTLLSTKEIALNCKHSTSGAYKKNQGIALSVGTGTPGMQYLTQLPFSDPAHLSARYTLKPSSPTEEFGPIVQDWDLRLAP
ncbi:hypothetical protein [Rhodoferax sp.]|uniref:hypothetical protein n=1 Tax=Rhodoferax sp. TaxID=50421 RepID=UPI002766817C|nr:hypothetical protein [Rhodoferax sp.]